MLLRPLARFAIPLLLLQAVAGAGSAMAASDTQIMVLGTFHMANPGRDLFDLHVDDVLAPQRQQQLAAVAASLHRFAPTLIALEGTQAAIARRDAAFRAGTLPPARDEVVQLGFRLAALDRTARVVGIDAQYDFPYQQLVDFARSHNQMPIVAAALDQTKQDLATLQTVLDHHTIAATLRFINDPARIAAGQSFYSQALRIGAGDQQPGVDLVTDWFHRNLLICTNLLRAIRSGDRVVVFYGAGHLFYLRQCLVGMPGVTQLDPSAYLDAASP